eukprot:CAMPEP_0202685360 /NCGR_PEP_ID=MMETSP1385-20130828/1093_1 /ASSEMBLY_ACC=CAM_ASM_000861 /TAXON_ID=933848 /ORGANISM="Elphidium margaritaceum" /LENGTH=559 /DNA_ID=CAMNT_0049339687 /DNA_START=212 /DNA_END=1888 /DNA_ORIENTATION=-
MTALETMNMNHANFTQFVADTTVLANAHLLATVVSAIQSLKLHQKHDQAQQQTKLIFLTQKENRTFVTLEQYVAHFQELQKEFSSVIPSALDDRKQRNTQSVERYSQSNSDALDAMRTTVSDTMHRLHAVLNENEKNIQRQLNKYRDDIGAIDTAHLDRVKFTQKVLHEAVKLMDADIVLQQQRINECRDIVSKYEDMDVPDDDHFTMDNDEDREREIVQIGNSSATYYDAQANVFAVMKSKIEQYIEPRLTLNVDQRMHFVSINVVVHQEICDHVQQKLMQCRDTRHAIRKPARVPPLQKHNNVHNKQQQRVQLPAKASSASAHSEPMIVIKVDAASNQAQSRSHDVPPMAYSVSYTENELLSQSHVVDIKQECDEFSEGPPTPPPPRLPSNSAPPVAVNVGAGAGLLQTTKKLAKTRVQENSEIALPSNTNTRVQDDYKHQESAIFAAIQAQQQAAYHRAKNQIAIGHNHDMKEPESMWKCSVCTFEENPGSYLMCDMCGSSKQMSLQRSQAMSAPASPQSAPQSAPVLIPQSNSDFDVKRNDSHSASEKLKSEQQN